jgi:hypothetical protein
VKIRRTANYHPECDGLSKRKIRQVKNKLGISYQVRGPKNFGQKLREVTECINDERTRGLQTTPREARKIFDKQGGSKKTKLIERVKDYNERTAEYTNKKRGKNKEIKTGDWVLIKKQGNKTCEFTDAVMDGPFLIIGKKGESTYELQIEKTNRGQNIYNEKLLSRYYK